MSRNRVVPRAAVAVVAALLAISGLSCIDIDGDGWSVPTIPNVPRVIVGSGNVVQQSRAIGPFSGVDLMGEGHLHITPGNRDALRLRAEDNLLAHLRTAVVGGVLEISTEPGVTLNNTLPIEYFLTATRLDTVQLEGVGDIECAGLSTDTIALESTGVGRIEFTDLELRELEVSMSGVGNVRTTGSVELQRVFLSGVGDYRARRLHSAEAEVEIHSLGSATVRVSDRLDALVTGSGCIYYLGSPVVTSRVTGSGCVEQIGG